MRERHGFQLLGVSPCGRPDAGIVAALTRAGAVGILEMGSDADAAAKAVTELDLQGLPFGVRVEESKMLRLVPADASPVVLAGIEPQALPSHRVLVEVCSVKEARAAMDAGAFGVVAKGCDSSGRVGSQTAFILFQQLLKVGIPRIFVQGGIGPYGQGAFRALGAAGVILDSQLALFDACRLPEEVKAAIGRMDGSEPTLVDGRSVLDLGGGATIPCGQDGALAAPLARRYKEIDGMVGAFRRLGEALPRQARRLRHLAPASPFAAAYGIEYPVAQGPMTRVSDRPEFADAVARAGGLPFVALSLSSSEESRKLLTQTKALLGDRPFGVGTLGFIDADKRKAQKEAILEIHPAAVLIAGGRPQQARPFEEAGIPTFLHVPSPGLLSIFLKASDFQSTDLREMKSLPGIERPKLFDGQGPSARSAILDGGARRLIFEGRECGGHVGPRTSLVLWEQAIEILLSAEDVDGVECLFAGGIHDRLSAAFVAVMTAPLAAAGCRVGLLMGTGYIFTKEAVETGAILPRFQEQSIACKETVLLESAPGHVTRAATTPFAREFQETRQKLLAEKRPPREVAEKLEKLNLGRLRIATRGIKRSASDLVQVDDATQTREGLYMLGQAAALHQEVITMEELHRDVTEGAMRELSAEEPRIEGGAPTAADIAIIGMGGFYPDSHRIEEFWMHILSADNCIREVPDRRWNKQLYYDENGGDGKSTSKAGGFLPEIAFDPLVYGIPPRSLAAVEPVQLLALEAARQALEDADYLSRPFARETASVIFGAEAGTDLAAAYGFRALYPQLLGALPPELAAVLPVLTEDSFAGVLANVIAGRIANRLDFGGANFTVDAACGSSLAALRMSCHELRSGTSSLVLCGGADLHNAIGDYLMFSSVHALSRSGRSACFDRSGDGIVLGEGVAALVLKRLEDAREAGDRIYAVIRSVGASSDGKSLGLTAPRKEGQMRALKRAYQVAGLGPCDVGLMEAHGTGTVVGDRTELQTMTEVFSEAGVEPASVTLGSVKSQIGHTKCSAGLAGIIKTSLSIYRRVLPPTIGIAQPNEAWDGATSPFVFRSKPAPWTSKKRVAGVSAFGFGGTNFHALLESAEGDEAPASGLPIWPREIFLFQDEEEMRKLRELAKPPALLRDLAYTQALRSQAPAAVAIVAGSVEDLARLLDAALDAREEEGIFRQDGVTGQLAFLFAGQGSQRPGMLHDLFVAFPRLQEVFQTGPDWLDRLFPPDAFDQESRRRRMAAVTDTRVAQPALGAVELAAAKLLFSLGIAPDSMAGHSYGEVAALAAAGAIPPDRLLEISAARARAILEAAPADPGTMAACQASREEIEPLIEGISGVVTANLNAPKQAVISGERKAVESACQALAAAGIRARAIPVACAFHSPLLAKAPDLFRRSLDEVEMRSPRIPVYSNAEAALHPQDPDAIRDALCRQLVSPVRFVEEVEAMYEKGARLFAEIGPGRVLTGLVGKILGDRPHRTFNLEGEGLLGGLLSLLAGLATAGVAFDLKPLFAGRGAKRIAETGFSPTTWLVDGQRALPLQGDLPPFAMKIVLRPLAIASKTVPIAAGDREEVIMEYLRGVREQAESQRQVLLSYLGRFQPVLDRPVSAAAPRAIEAERVEQPPSAAESQSAPKDESPAEVLLAIVSERTGYPVEMLDLDLDLEADLSIDSIKRMEILGLLAERLGFGAVGGGDEMMEELAGLKTLREILARIERSGGASEVSETAAAGTEESAAPESDGVPVPEKTLRFVPVAEPIEPVQSDPKRLAALSIGIIPGDSPLGLTLAEALRAVGADPVPLSPEDRPGRLEMLVFVPGGDSDRNGEIVQLALQIREALARGTRSIVAVTGQGGKFGLDYGGSRLGAGIAGLLKSVKRENPDITIRIVDVRPEDPDGDVASLLLGELADGGAPLEVGYRDGKRYRRRFAEVPLPKNGEELTLEEGSVVLATGGARGITARVAVALAKERNCRLVLIGRSPLPSEEESQVTRAASSATELRRILISTGMAKKPAEAERLCRRILADREMRGTFEALAQAGIAYEYEPLDVRDGRAFGLFLEDLYARYGRLDGVIHGAGVNEDKLLRDKDPESFRRVFETKVAAARELAQKLRDDCRFLFFLSSVASAFGNRGQADYAAANDVLDKLATALDGSFKGRVLSVNFGPWGGGGMVTPELEREYERRGIGLIDPDEGVQAVLEELAFGSSPRVVLMRAYPRQMEE